MLKLLGMNLMTLVRFALAAGVVLFSTSSFAMDGDLTHFRLPNGLAVFVKEDHSRKVAAIQMWVMVGAAYENDSERGISHVIEHMAFKGTKRRGVGRIAEEVEEIGGQINAYTIWDETVFHVIVPSSATSQGLDIITDAVFRSIIDQKELENEKKVVLGRNPGRAGSARRGGIQPGLQDCVHQEPVSISCYRPERDRGKDHP